MVVIIVNDSAILLN